MAYASIVTITTRVTGDGANNGWTPPGAPLTNNAAPASGPQKVDLNTGDNPLDVPDAATGVVISPPLGSTIDKTLKGAPGDTGIALAQAAPSVLSLAPGTGRQIHLNASGSETINLQWF